MAFPFEMNIPNLQIEWSVLGLVFSDLSEAIDTVENNWLTSTHAILFFLKHHSLLDLGSWFYNFLLIFMMDFYFSIF